MNNDSTPPPRESEHVWSAAARALREPLADSPSWGQFMVLVGLPLFLLFGFLWIGPRIAIEGYCIDFWVPLSVGWRILQGQVSNIDFINPLGPLYGWTEALALYWTHGSPKAVALAELILVLPVFLAATLVASRRLAWPTATVFVFSTCMILLSPRSLDLGFESFSYLAAYNRVGWASLMSICLVFLIHPKDSTKNFNSVEIFMLSVLVASTFLTKLPMYLVAVGFLTLSVTTKGERWTGPAAAILGTFAGFVVLALFGHPLSYLADLRSAIEVSNDNYGDYPFLRSTHLINAILLNLPATILAGVALMMVKKLPGHRFVPALITLIAGSALAMQCADATIPIMILIPIAAHEALRRAPTNAFLLGISLFLAIAQPIKSVGVDLLSIIASGMEAFAEIKISHFVNDPSSHGYNIVSKLNARPRNVPPNYSESIETEPATVPTIYSTSLTAPEQNWIWSHAYTLIKPLVKPDSRILTIGFVNPYPYLTQTKNPPTDLAWWDSLRTFGPNVHPDISKLLLSTTLVVEHINTRDGNYQPKMNAIFDPELKKSFHLIHEDKWIRLWSKD